jgi:hypothetical protein
MSDKITIEILEDGKIKMSTDKISAANHGGAEMLIREMVKKAGGKENRTRKANAHYHEHNGEFHSH